MNERDSLPQCQSSRPEPARAARDRDGVRDQRGVELALEVAPLAQQLDGDARLPLIEARGAAAGLVEAPYRLI